MPSTNFLFSGLSSCAEYQQVEMMPMASSPICCSNDSSIAVMPPRIGVLPPYSLYCLKNLNPLEPAKPMKRRLRFMARGFSHRLFSHQAGYHPYISGPILSRGSHPGGGSHAINFL